MQESKIVFAASAISATSSTLFLLMPLLIGVLIDDLGLSNQDAGFLASIYFGGYLGVCLSIVFWIHKVNWRWLSMLAHGLLIGGLSGAAFTVNYSFLLCLFFVAGCGGGTLFSLCIKILSASSKPDRNFGFKLAAEQLVAAVLLFLLPWLVISNWGFRGFCISVALVFAVLSISTTWLPKALNRPDETTHASNSQGTIGVWLALFCLMLFMAGLSGVWAFVERIASSNDISAVNIGRALSYGVIGGGLGAFAAAALNDRHGRAIPLLVSLVLLSAVLFVLSINFDSAIFIVVCIFLSGMWNFSMAYQMGVVANTDKSGTLSVLMSSGLALGAMIGPGIAGLIIRDNNFIPATVFAFISILLASIVLASIDSRSRG